MANKKRVSSVTVAQIIEARGQLTQGQAAEALGVSLRTWSGWERGERTMRENDLEQVAKASKLLTG